MGDHRARAIRRSEARTDLLGRRLGFAELVFSVGLLTELCAPLGLFGEGALVAVGVALVAFHAATSLLLTVRFPEYQLILVSFFIVPAFVP